MVGAGCVERAGHLAERRAWACVARWLGIRSMRRTADAAGRVPAGQAHAATR